MSERNCRSRGLNTRLNLLILSLIHSLRHTGMTRTLPPDLTTTRIAIIDSGVGGLSYLSAIRSTVPSAAVCYVADNEGFPYGEWSEEPLQSRVLEVVAAVRKRLRPNIVVIACNTATVNAIAATRRRYPDLAVVGVVPAVKPALQPQTNSPAPHGPHRPERVGVLATDGTVRAEYLNGLIAKFEGGRDVVRIGCGELVRLIESDVLDINRDEVQTELARIGDKVKSLQISSVVLGCTHFVHVRTALERNLGPRIAVHDSCDGVARRVGEIATRFESQRQVTGSKDTASGVEPNFDGVPDTPHNNATPLLFTTEQDTRWNDIARAFGLSYRGTIGPVGTSENPSCSA